MNTAGIVKPPLAKARRDLEDATEALGHVWVASDHDAIGDLTTATEALVRAIASVTLAVERLTDAQADEPHKYAAEHEADLVRGELAVDHSVATGTCDCAPQCQQAAAERTVR